MRVAVIGKGGVGKSVISATLARLLARRGERVLALDADPLPGLSLSLGSGPDPAPPPLAEAVVQGADGRWGWRPGIDAEIAAERFSTAAPDGVRLLQRGKAERTRTAPVVVVLPTTQSAMTARRVARLARAHRTQTVLFVANRVQRADDVAHLEKLLGEPVFASIPDDEAVRRAERAGVATIDHAPDCATVAAVQELATRLGSIGASSI